MIEPEESSCCVREDPGRICHFKRLKALHLIRSGFFIIYIYIFFIYVHHRSRLSFGYLWGERRKRGKSDTAQEETGQTERTQRKTYKLASAEDSDVPSPKNERPRQLAWTSRPSSAVCQAKLNLRGERGSFFLFFISSHCFNILPFLFN